MFSYPILTQIMDYFSCSQPNALFYWINMKKGFQKILYTLRCDMVTSFLHYTDVADRRKAANVRLYVFIFPQAGIGM